MIGINNTARLGARYGDFFDELARVESILLLSGTAGRRQASRVAAPLPKPLSP